MLEDIEAIKAKLSIPNPFLELESESQDEPQRPKGEANPPECVKCGSRMIRNGVTTAGKERFACTNKLCRATITITDNTHGGSRRRKKQT